MNKKALALIVLTLLIVGELLVNRASSADVYPDAGFKTDWDGKVLVISTRLNQRTAYVERASVRRLGDQWFVVGTQLEFDRQTWTEGKVTWIVLSDVSSIVEVGSADEMRKIVAQLPTH